MTLTSQCVCSGAIWVCYHHKHSVGILYAQNEVYAHIVSSIEKLKLKIPWKSLYSSPIVAEIDGLYAIVEPATGIYKINDTLPLYI